MKILILCTLFQSLYIQIFYSGYFHPFDKPTEKISGDSTAKVTSEKEIQISASIARGLLVNVNDQLSNIIIYCFFTVFR